MSNAHIFEFLDYYVDLPRPPFYAVMLTGPWGIGKSFHIKRYVAALRQKGKKVAYVSLYGVRSIDELTLSVLGALTSKPDSNFAKLGSQLARAVLPKLASGNVEAALWWLPDGFCDLLILDDLERAVLSPVEVLAFVNSFIEHEDRKVVLVANEEKLDDPDYRNIREKVIGETFEFSEETDTALQHFIGMLGDVDTKSFLIGGSAGIRRIFDQSKTKNLRLLDQSIRSWERVHKVIDPALKKKNAGMRSAFELFLALSLEIRSGRIGKGSLQGRVDKIVVGQMSKRDKKQALGTPLSEAQDRYGRLHLHDSILSDEVLTQVLCDGRIDAQAINSSLAVHPLFVEPDHEPSWRKVWFGFERDASEFEAAFKAMEQEFTARQFEEPGLVLHVLGLRLWGAKLGEIALTEQGVISEGKEYINDLRRAGKLRRYQRDGFRDSAYGLQYHGTDTQAFQELHTYFEDQCKYSYQDGWPALAEGLLNDMVGDGKAFYERVCWTGGQTRPDCADDPILAMLSPERFVDRLVDCPPEAQRTVLEALKSRYERGGLTNTLTAECQWLMDVHTKLSARLPALPRIRRYSLSNDSARCLGRALTEAHAAVLAVANANSPAPAVGSPSANIATIATSIASNQTGSTPRYRSTSACWRTKCPFPLEPPKWQLRVKN